MRIIQCFHIIGAYYISNVLTFRSPILEFIIFKFDRYVYGRENVQLGLLCRRGSFFSMCFANNFSCMCPISLTGLLLRFIRLTHFVVKQPRGSSFFSFVFVCHYFLRLIFTNLSMWGVDHGKQ